MLTTALIILFIIVTGLSLILIGRYISLNTKTGVSSDLPIHDSDLPELDFEGFIRRFQRLIQIPTVSWTDKTKIDATQFSTFQNALVEQYPMVHDRLTRTVLGDFGLIYHWQGTNPEEKPILFLAHYDVVPAEEKGGETWENPPFSGTIRDGVLWGRGTLDIKCMIAFYMESIETLLKKGWQPRHDIYFAFGGDEEISGVQGAGEISKLFKERGLEFEFVMDEGGTIAKDELAFLKGRPVALLGLAEKGFVTLKIKATGESGHSSMPGKTGTAIGKLARAVVKLERNPFPPRLGPVLRTMLERFVPFVSVGLGIIFANLWLFAPLVRFIFTRSKVTDSLVRTTQAVTVFRSGEQENILPGEAVCLVNHRILPGDTIMGIFKRYQKLLKDKELTIEDAGNWPANDPILSSDLNASGFQLVSSVLATTHPTAIIAPYLVNGSTDSKYYRDLTEQILRFTPLILTPDDISSIHGVNEKVSIQNLKNGLEFYIRLFSRL